MRKFILVILLGFALPAEASDYAIDVSHSTIGFKVKHLMISTVSGRFDRFNGTGKYDEKTGVLSDLRVSIESSSVNTNDKKRDKHLRTPDFFSVKKFPKIEFNSNKISVHNKKPNKINGELTLRGVKKLVSFDVTFGGSGVDPWGNKKVAFTATTKINRKDFGITWNKSLDAGGVLVGDEITVVVEIEANAK